MTQLQLNFEPGLTAQFKTLEDVLSACVYGSRGGLQASAIEADQSPSELSRRLNATDQLPLRVGDMVSVLDATKDLRPIYWLIERYIQDPDVTRKSAIAELARIMPIVQALVEASAEAKIKLAK